MGNIEFKEDGKTPKLTPHPQHQMTEADKKQIVKLQVVVDNLATIPPFTEAKWLRCEYDVVDGIAEARCHFEHLGEKYPTFAPYSKEVDGKTMVVKPEFPMSKEIARNMAMALALHLRVEVSHIAIGEFASSEYSFIFRGDKVN